MFKNEKGSVLPMYLIIVPTVFFLFAIIVDIYHLFIARQALYGVADAAAGYVVNDNRTIIFGTEICMVVDGEIDECHFYPDRIEVWIANNSEDTAKQVAEEMVNLNNPALKGVKNIETNGRFFSRDIPAEAFVKGGRDLPISITPGNSYEFEIRADIPVVLLGLVNYLFGSSDRIDTVSIKVKAIASPMVDIVDFYDN